MEVLHENKWSLVCNDAWILHTAHAVCQHVGYAEASRAIPGVVASHAINSVSLKTVKVESVHQSTSREPILVVYPESVCVHGMGARVSCSVKILEGKRDTALGSHEDDGKQSESTTIRGSFKKFYPLLQLMKEAV